MDAPKRSILHKFILSIVLLPCLLVFNGWLERLFSLGAPKYLLQNSIALLIGQETVGQIESLVPNQERPDPENYFALITYQTKSGKSISGQFRYANSQVENNLKQVHIKYLLDNPEHAALREDAGFFWSTLKALFFFLTFFFTVFFLIFLADYIFKPKKKKRGMTAKELLKNTNFGNKA